MIAGAELLPVFAPPKPAHTNPANEIAKKLTGRDYVSWSALSTFRTCPVTTTDNIRWTLSGLDTATVSAGTYSLTLNATGSGIVAVDGGAALSAGASDTWTTNAATLVDAGDSIATSAPLGITSGTVRLSGRVGDGSDAEVDAREGKNYVWLPDQIKDAIADESLASLALEM